MYEYSNFIINQSWNPTSKPISALSSSKPSNILPLNYPEFKTTDSAIDSHRVLALNSSTGMERNSTGSNPLTGVRTLEWSGVPFPDVNLLFRNISVHTPHSSCLYECSPLGGHSKQLVHDLKSANVKKETTPNAS